MKLDNWALKEAIKKASLITVATLLLMSLITGAFFGIIKLMMYSVPGGVASIVAFTFVALVIQCYINIKNSYND